jgi:DNA-binding transcriptional ArsR family regulator
MAEDSELQALSRILFGQAHRLAVMFAIARGDGLFNPGDMSAELGFRAQSSIQDPLRDLEKAGLITRSPKVGTRVFYTRNPSKVWPWIEEIVAAQRPAPGTDGGSPSEDHTRTRPVAQRGASVQERADTIDPPSRGDPLT